MACFLAPTVEAVVVSIVKHRIEKNETSTLEKFENRDNTITTPAQESKIPFSRKLSWLSNLLWGGSFLLLFEHIWHGEIVPYYPFLTAMNNKADAIVMLKEIATAGVAMAALCTTIWLGMLLVCNIIERNRAKALAAKV